MNHRHKADQAATLGPMSDDPAPRSDRADGTDLAGPV